MTYQFTQIDNEVLDFMVQHFHELMAQIEADKGQSVYRYYDLKLVITKEKHPNDY